MASVGPYVLGRTLGAGATSKVKLGTHRETRQSVAIKIVSKEWLQTKANLSRKIERCGRGLGPGVSVGRCGRGC
jgi:hypothetical protein